MCISCGKGVRLRPDLAQAALVLALVLLPGCGPSIDIARVPAWDPQPLAAAETVAPIAWARAIYDTPRFAPIGHAYAGWTCMIPVAPVAIDRARRTVDDPELAAIFEERMAAAGFDVAGAVSTLFEEQGATRARYLIGARLTDFAVELCESESPIFGIPQGDSGEMSLTAHWEVFSVLERRVVHRTTTRGYARRGEPSLHGGALLLHEAFAAAVTNLAGDQGLRTLLLDAGAPARLFASSAPGSSAPGSTAPGSTAPGSTAPGSTAPNSTAPPATAITAAATITLPALPPFRGTLAGHAETVRAAVVLIDTGFGHGSGFLVSPDGYILTNAHVVAEAEQVRVTLHDGRVRVGDVLRRQRRRDVALVRIPGGGYPALPIRTAPVAVGGTVHAIGAPLRRDLAGTLTRGVVSALRRDEGDGQAYIQADVTVQGGNSGGPLVDAAGNVVGITVSGVAASPDGLSVGLNFFIPIFETLDRLGLRRAGADG